MRRGLGKPQLRVVGVDDGSFLRTERRAPVVAVILSGPSYVEAVLRTSVAVDGDDATAKIASMLVASPHLDGVRGILVDGVAVGGFNLLDLAELSRVTDRPVVSVTRRRPEFASIRSALEKYFRADFERRWSLVRSRPLFQVPTGGEPIWASASGCRRVDAIALVRRTLVRGYWPEPLRLAHLIARAYGRSAARGTATLRSEGSGRRGGPREQDSKMA
ncbi:MAG: DUF99 family protein [Thermoplasmata archaeon]|nr:DUF99 family protein [Thermoplasmata archaeon]